jgi:hypothetical protein
LTPPGHSGAKTLRFALRSLLTNNWEWPLLLSTQGVMDKELGGDHASETALCRQAQNLPIHAVFAIYSTSG